MSARWGGARRIRPAVLAALALASLAACTRPSETPQSAAAGAGPAAAPDVTKTGYMAEHVAKDAALADALVGRWSERVTQGGVAYEVQTTYYADHTAAAAITRLDTGTVTPFTGTWTIAHGFLTEMFAGDRGPPAAAEILRIDARELVYIHSEDKTTKVATRVTATAARPPMAPVAASPFDVEPTPAAVMAAQRAAEAGPAPFVDETLFVATEDAVPYVFRLAETSRVKLTAEIDAKVPVNIVLLPGRMASMDYMTLLGTMLFGTVMKPFLGKDEQTAGFDDLFKSRLSKQSAYGQFASPWVTLEAGTYTVMLDNTGELSPTRGDAPVRLRLYRRAAS